MEHTDLNRDAVALDLAWLNVIRNVDEPDSPNRLVSRVPQRDQRRRDAVYDSVMNDLRGTGFAEWLLFVEQFVVTELFVIDKMALDARLGSIPAQLDPYVQRRTPPLEVYQAAASAVGDLLESLQKSQDSSPELSEFMKEATASGASEFWSPCDKAVHDYMHNLDGPLRLVASAASTGGDTLARALFYLEFGRHLGDVPLLGPGKRRWLQIIGKGLNSSVHEVIAKKFDGTVLARINAQMADAFMATTLRPPPIAELVLKKAIVEGLTLLEAACVVRETQPATDYRGMLSELRHHMRQGRSGMLKAQKALAGLNKIADAWASYNDPLIGVTRNMRKLSVEKLPYIGALLKAADMNKFEIRDRILEAPPGYLAFISSWYREQPVS